jgi:hypothetical protein
MARARHSYERWYYYRDFKRGMDRAYRHAAVATLFLAVWAGISFRSFLAALAFGAIGVFYHGSFIGRRQPRLARFWGEGGQGAGALTRLWIEQWVGYVLLLVLIAAVGQSLANRHASLSNPKVSAEATKAGS